MRAITDEMRKFVLKGNKNFTAMVVTMPGPRTAATADIPACLVDKDYEGHLHRYVRSLLFRFALRKVNFR
jgi:hypothetical protein